jgi:epoxyqueuosine reductase
VVDARRCLSWIAQAPGSMPHEYREVMHDRLYGCDDCQEVCPPNRKLVPRPSSHGPEAPGDLLDARWVLAAGDDELLAKVGRWFISDRDPRWIRRNALVAIGNTADPHDPAVRAEVTAVAEGHDGVLAEHATWALARLDTRAAHR